MKRQHPTKFMVTGGGTGGHIYPAIAVAKDLESCVEGLETVYVGTFSGIESEVVPNEGMRFISIDARGFSGRSKLRHINTLGTNLKGCAQALAILKREKPALVLGTGGYVSAPIVFMANLMQIPTAIHEQNVVPGRANRFLAPLCKHIFVTYPETAHYFGKSDKIVLTGNPVREQFKAVERSSSRAHLGWDASDFVVLSFGGSGGAKKINDLMMDVIEKFNGRSDIRIIHITGRKYYDRFMMLMNDRCLQMKENIQVLPYVHDIHHYMAASNVVITRSGATSLAEIQAVRTPAILIPSPNVKDNHQEYNARIFEKCGMAIVIPERELTFSHIETKLLEYMDKPEILERMKVSCKMSKSRDPLELIREKLIPYLKEAEVYCDQDSV